MVEALLTWRWPLHEKLADRPLAPFFRSRAATKGKPQIFRAPQTAVRQGFAKVGMTHRLYSVRLLDFSSTSSPRLPPAVLLTTRAQTGGNTTGGLRGGTGKAPQHCGVDSIASIAKIDPIIVHQTLDNKASLYFYPRSRKSIIPPGTNGNRWSD